MFKVEAKGSPIHRDSYKGFPKPEDMYLEGKLNPILYMAWANKRLSPEQASELYSVMDQYYYGRTQYRLPVSAVTSFVINHCGLKIDLKYAYTRIKTMPIPEASKKRLMDMVVAVFTNKKLPDQRKFVESIRELDNKGSSFVNVVWSAYCEVFDMPYKAVAMAEALASIM